jgi:Fe-S-cluster containining protein
VPDSTGPTPSSERSVTEVLKDIFSKLDPIAKDHAERAQVSCKKGCNHCCKLLTTIMVSEGLLIAEALLKDGTWRSFLPELKESALAHCFEGICNATYFDKRRPCVFLSKKGQGVCDIYSIRPSCCRYHYVTSEPEKCSPEAPRDTQTAALDLMPLDKEVWMFDNHVSRELFNTPLMSAPIPVMVLFCMDYMTQDDITCNREIKKWMEGVPTPIEWMKKYGIPSLVLNKEISAEEAEVMIGLTK